MFYSFALPRRHIWSQWRFVLIAPSSLTGALWLLINIMKILDLESHTGIFVLLCVSHITQTVIENCIKNFNMVNAKYSFSFIFRQKISPQSPIMLAAGNHLYKGKSSIQKLPDH